MTMRACRRASCRAALLTSLAALCATGTWAAEEPRPQGPVERIEVRAGVDETGATLDPTAFATVIRAEEFVGRVTSVAELLRDAVGVQVRSLGGEFATVSIRGSSAEQVVVYLDGVPLNRALGGGVNLADLPLTQVESIEVYRGFTPAALSAASIGGAVVIHTRRATERSTRAASITLGSFGSAEGLWSISASRGRATWTAGVDAATSHGDFVFTDNNGTPTDGTDDSLAHRSNNAFWRAHLAGRLTVHAGRRARFEISTDVLARRQGVPGLDALQSKTAEYGTRRLVVRPEVEVPGLFGGRLLLRGATDYAYQTESFDDSLNPRNPRETDNRTAAFGQEIGFTLVASAHQAVSLLATRRRETADLRNLAPEKIDLGSPSRETLNITLEDQISLGGGRLVLNPSLRHERYDSDFAVGASAGIVPGSPDRGGNDTSGKVGFRLRATDHLTIKGNAGRFQRLPSFSELFGDRGSVLGSPALLPERGRSFDLGFIATRQRAGSVLRRVRLELTLFETLADNLILIIPTAQTKVVAQNSGRARVRGTELSLALALGSRLTASLNATHQKAVDVSGEFADGKLLPGRPVDEVSATATADFGRGRAFYTFTYVGPNFVDRDNIESSALPARYLHDVGYRRTLSEGLTAVVEIKNLADQQTFDVARFPLPGRSIHGRLSWEF